MNDFPQIDLKKSWKQYCVKEAQSRKNRAAPDELKLKSMLILEKDLDNIAFVFFIYFQDYNKSIKFIESEDSTSLLEQEYALKNLSRIL